MSKQLIPTLYFVHTGTSTIEVRIEPHSKKINVIEGSFSILAKDQVTVDIATDLSVLTMWPVPPRFMPEENIVSFTGGVPLGFDEEGLLFSMIFSLSDSSATTSSAALSTSSTVSFSPDDLSISWISGSSYLNDGIGTKQVLNVETAIRRGDGSTVDTAFYSGGILIGLLFVVLLVVFRYAYTKHITK